MSLPMEHEDFQHILRIMNTNVDGTQKVWVALTALKGMGRRFSILCCKKAEIDLKKRAGELTPEEIAKVAAILNMPKQFKIPTWFFNRRKDFFHGEDKHVASNALDNTLREDLERLRKIYAHRGLRHHWKLRVRGQHTKTTGRNGRTVGVSTKKK